MVSFVLYGLYLVVAWLPCMLLNPVHENASGLYWVSPLAYWAWILCVVAVLVWAGRRLSFWFRYVPAFLLVVAGAIPYRAAGPGWINDLHVWLQVLALVLYGYGWLKDWWYGRDVTASAVLVCYGAGFVLLCMCGCVSGLAESVFATGMGLVVLAQKKRRSGVG